MHDRELTWKPKPRGTSVRLPAGATDCHCHIFGPVLRFPYAAQSSFKPADAPKEALFALHEQMGITRAVVVQSGCHGFDNAVVVDAMATRPGRYVGVALTPADADDATLDALAAQGFRGVRFNYMAHLAPGASDTELKALAPRLADRGMHLQIHMDASLIEPMSGLLRQLPCTVVIDHMGRVDASRGISQAPFQALLHLLDAENFWCKVSASERISRQDPPYEDAWPFARAIISRFGERVVWGSDWPHPNFRAAPPDDGDLFDLLPHIATTQSALTALMVENPARLYRFKEI